MYIGNLRDYIRENGGDISSPKFTGFAQSENRIPFPPCSLSPALSKETLPWSQSPCWSWEQILNNSLDLHFQFTENGFLDCLDMELASESGLASICLFADGKCIASVQHTEDMLSRHISLKVNWHIEKDADYILRLRGCMMEIRIEQLIFTGSVWDTPFLYPVPTKMQLLNDLPVCLQQYSFTPVCSSNDSDLQWISVIIKERFHKPDRQIFHVSLAKSADIPAEGYRLRVTPSEISLTASDKKGFLYGTEALSQLYLQDCVPSCVLEDQPRANVRGVHFGLPAREDIPFFKALLRNFLAPLGYNTLFLQFTAGMKFDRHPELNIAWEDACRKSFCGEYPPLHHRDMIAGGSYLEKSEVEDLVLFAKEWGFDVIPEIQSLSHVQYITIAHPELAELPDPEQLSDISDERKADIPPDAFYPHCYCPSNPESYALIFDIIDEIIEVVKPQYVHMGHDEVYYIGLCPKCRESSPAELFARHVNKIHDYLAGKNLKMMIWSDMLQPDSPYKTTAAIKQLPKDLVMLDFIWYFHLQKDLENHLLENGFSVIAGNFYSSHYPRVNSRLSKPHILGGEVSTWCQANEEVLSREGKLFDFLYSAEILRDENYEPKARYTYTKLASYFLPYLKARMHSMYGFPVDSESFGLGYLQDWKGEKACTFAETSYFSAGYWHPFWNARVKDKKVTLQCLSPGQNVFVPVSPCNAFAILHGTIQTLTKLPYQQGAPIGEITIHYEDHTASCLALHFGSEIGPVHSAYGMPESHPYFRHTGYSSVWSIEPAVSGKTRNGEDLTLYSYIVKSSRKITGIDYHCLSSANSSVLLAGVYNFL